MSRALAARAAVVCTLCVGVTARPHLADAQPRPKRPVAVIDLSGEPAAKQLTTALGDALADHHELRQISDATITVWLIGELANNDANRLEGARKHKIDAEQRLVEFRFESAVEEAVKGQVELHWASPTTLALQAYSALAFVVGQAQLGLRKTPEAAIAFALAHRLNPEFAPDPARYLPEVVQAFERAKSAPLGSGKLEIAGSGRIWIDGRQNGRAPGAHEVGAGPHVIWLTGDERQARGGQVVVPTSGMARIEIEDAPVTKEDKVTRARQTLWDSYKDNDTTVRATVMQQLADLLDVRDAVLLTSENGKVFVQTWRGDATIPKLEPGFSKRTEYKNEPAADVLRPLSQPKPETPVGTITPIPVKPVELRWYQKRKNQLGLSVATIAAVIGGVVFFRSLTEDTIGTISKTQFEE